MVDKMSETVSKEPLLVNEIPNFDKSIHQAVKALAVIEASRNTTEVSQKKNLITDDDEKILLTFGLKKLPFVKYDYTSVTKVPLPHPIFNSSTSICLFVKDLVRNGEDENTIASFRELLDKNNLSSLVSEIIPLHVLHTEFKPFEARRKLSHSYDLFLTDDRIAAYLFTQIGKEFWKLKKLPIKINLNARDLKKEFDRVLSNTFYYSTGTGSLSSVHVANSSQSENEKIENIESAISFFMKTVPGGVDNIRSIHLKTQSTIALPIYISTSSCDHIKMPVINFKKRSRVDSEELSTKLNTNVKVYPDGYIKVIKDKTLAEGSGESTDEDDDYQEIIQKKRIGFHRKASIKSRNKKVKTKK